MRGWVGEEHCDADNIWMDLTLREPRAAAGTLADVPVLTPALLALGLLTGFTLHAGDASVGSYYLMLSPLVVAAFFLRRVAIVIVSVTTLLAMSWLSIGVLGPVAGLAMLPVAALVIGAITLCACELRERTPVPVTGATNRAGLEARLNDYLAAGRSFSLLLVDVDHFRQIHEDQGQTIGEAVLGGVAARLTANTRAGDVYRLVGDEFAVLLPGCTGEQACSRAALVVQQVALTPFIVGESIVEATISVGVACSNKHSTLGSLYAAAEKSLTSAKEAGRGCVGTAA